METGSEFFQYGLPALIGVVGMIGLGLWALVVDENLDAENKS